MIVLGLTGSIGMGKSTAARAFVKLGAALWDADEAVHRALGPNGTAVNAVLAAFPSTRHETPDGLAVNRQALGKIVFKNKTALRHLEAIVHPLIRGEERRFLAQARRARRKLVVLDIPLLFEGQGGGRVVDAAVVVSAPTYIQRARVLRRSGMTMAKFEGILRHQLADAEKRRRADFVVPTGLGKRESLRAVRAIVRRVTSRANHTEMD
ncbi:MAG: dephospho-CoA kinase [Alphaproteobacteria bacterium]|nr:dephospho-CoA kinase [Alphaproteobacteria bacterium]